MMTETGSTTIEMIAWLPVLLIILAAIVQFGLYFNARNAVQAAAFEASRQAVVSNNPEATGKAVSGSYARGTLPGWSEGERLATRISISGRGGQRGTVTVSVNYDTPEFLPGITKDSNGRGWLNVSGESEMEIEERP